MLASRSLSMALVAALVLVTGCGRVSPAAAGRIGSSRLDAAGSATSRLAADSGLASGGLLAAGVGNASGRLMEQGSNRPVANATVLVEPGAQRVTTDASGQFQFAGLQAGNYTFTAMAPGLTQVTPAGVLVEANQAASVPDILMVPGNGPSGVTSVSYTQTAAFGDQGLAPAPLLAPVGLAVRSGDVLALDVNGSLGVKTGIIRQYNGLTGAFAGKYGDYSKWIGLGQMKNTVRAIAVDSQGRALVLDATRQIWRFKPDGNKDKLIAVNADNGNAIAVDPASGMIYLASASGLLRLSAEGDNAQTVGNVGACIAVAAAKDGVWAIANNLVTKLGADGTASTQFGPAGTGGGDTGPFSEASAIAVDPRNGNLVVVDKGAKQVYVYDGVGTLIGKIGQGVFEQPSHVAIDPVGDVYVLDRAKKKIYKFAPGASH